MNFRTTIILIVLLAGAGAYVAVRQLSGPSKESASSASTTGKLVGMETADVTKLSIAPADGQKIVAEKTGTQWRLVEPIKAPADQFTVEDIIRAVTALQSRGELAEDKKASVGLDHPSYVVELTDKNGKTTKVSVGEKNQVADSLYVLVDEQKKPQIVASALYTQLDKQPDAFRSKKLVDVTNDQVKQISITRGDKTVRLEKPGTDWQIVEPKKMPADSTAVSDLLWAATGLNATNFVEKPSGPSAYGLATPITSVWFSTQAPTTQPATAPATQGAGATIVFGRYESVLQKDVYASVDGGPIVTVPTSSLESFNKTALDLRDKKVADIDPAHVESFTLTIDRAATTQPTTKPAEQKQITIARRKEAAPVLGPLPAPVTQPVASTQPTTRPAVASTQPTTAPVAATQPASKWVFQSGGNGDADDGQVDALLGALHPLRAEKFLEKPPTTQPAAAYSLVVRAGPHDGQGQQEFTFRFTNPGATGSVVGSYNELVFEIERSLLDKLDGDFKTKKAESTFPTPTPSPR